MSSSPGAELPAPIPSPPATAPAAAAAAPSIYDVTAASASACKAAYPSRVPVPFAAVTDIEDIRFVTIHGQRRPRPPIVPALCAYRRHLEPGRTYRFCTCGRSEEQPFCDDSHRDDDPEPIEFSVDRYQSFHALCGCKYSLMGPFCDGSHIHAVDGYEEVGAAGVPPAASADAVPPAGDAEHIPD